MARTDKARWPRTAAEWCEYLLSVGQALTPAEFDAVVQAGVAVLRAAPLRARDRRVLQVLLCIGANELRRGLAEAARADLRAAGWEGPDECH